MLKRSVKLPRDNYPKYLLTMDEGEEDFDGILRLNILQWLVE